MKKNKPRKLLTVEEAIDAPSEPASNAIGWTEEMSKGLGRAILIHTLSMEIDKHARLIDYALQTILSGDMEEAAEALRFSGLLEPKNEEEAKRIMGYLGMKESAK